MRATMFNNYLKIAFRNFWRNRRYSFVNIAGLALSLTCFILVVLYVQHQKSYDRWNPNANRVYQVNISYNTADLATALALKATGENPKSAEISTTTPAGIGPVLKEKIPEIQAYNRINMAEWSEQLITLPDKRKVYVNNIVGVDSSFFKVFPYPFLYGNAEQALNQPNDIVLFYTTAEKLFGNKNPVGETVRLNNDRYYTVTGVVNKPSTPSSINFGAVIRSENTDFPWGYKWFFTYVLLRPGADPQTVAAKMSTVLYKTPAAKGDFGDKTARIVLAPFPQLYLHPATHNQPGSTGNPLTLSILLVMAFLILVVSCINFTNLAITQSAGRAKEVGVRKVLGSSRFNVLINFLGETFLHCLLSILIALVAVKLVLPVVNNTLNIHLNLFNGYYTTKLVLYLASTLLGVTVLSGIYPAFFLSRYHPAKVLKGNFLRGKQGNFLRKALVVFQFIVTTGFIIAILIVNRQFQFLKYRSIGFDPQQVMDIRMHDQQTKKSFPFIKQRLLQLANVKAVSRVNYQPGSHSMTHSSYSVDEQRLEFDEVHVDYDFFQALGIQPLAGRLFSQRHAADSSGVILNKTAAEKYHLMDSVGIPLPALKELGNIRLLGIVPDYNQRGMDSKIAPMAFFLTKTPINEAGQNTDDRNHVLIRLTTQNVEQTISQIKNIWREAEPDYPIQYSFLDQQFASYLNHIVRLGKLVSIFTVCALLITLFGLFSLAALTAEQRTKEIAIRKVLGAGAGSIIGMLNRQFVVLIILANVLAWPVCYILIRQWLNGFNYRIAIPVLPFIIAAVATIGLTLFTVSMQAWQVARSNPVNALKYE